MTQRLVAVAERPPAHQAPVSELRDEGDRALDLGAVDRRRRQAANAEHAAGALLADLVVGDRQRLPLAPRDGQPLADAVVTAQRRAAVGERELAVGVDELHRSIEAPLAVRAPQRLERRQAGPGHEAATLLSGVENGATFVRLREG